MKEEIATTRPLSNSANQLKTPMPSIEVLTQEEQRNLIRGSYCHQYGILIRLPMFSGLKMQELLGLQWEDLDAYNCRLCVRHILAGSCDGLRIQTTSSPRFVPLHPHVFKDLMEWRDVLRNASIATPPPCFHPNSVATTLKRYQINPQTLEYYFCQILQFSGISNYSFDTLRNTFAVRALEQGMKMKTLCSILGDPNAASIYAQFEPKYNDINVALMETLLTVQQPNRLDVTYPVVVKPLENGLTQLFAPNFPEASCAGMDLTQGLIIMRERLEDQLNNSYYPPIPVPVASIPCGPDECIIQISVKL